MPQQLIDPRDRIVQAAREWNEARLAATTGAASRYGPTPAESARLAKAERALNDAVSALLPANMTSGDGWRDIEALARAARAYVEHPDLASARGTLIGHLQRVERALASVRPAPPTPKPEGGVMARTKVYCSFCGKAAHEVFCIVEGPAAGICDECVPLVASIIQEQRDTIARGEPFSPRFTPSTRQRDDG